MPIEGLRNRYHLTIQARIALLVIACILPAALLAVFVIYLSYDRERSNIRLHTLEIARGLMRVVERDLAANEAALHGLATSKQIDIGSFAAFHGQAQELLTHTSGFTIVLTDASGQQVVNLLRPYGSPLPRHGNPELLHRVLESRKGAISDLYAGAVVKKPVVSVEVPVIRDGKVPYVIDVGINPSHLGEILEKQSLPKDWVVSIFDGTGTIVARSHAGEQFVGHQAAPLLLARMREAAEGIVDTPTLEGIQVMAAFSRSSVSGWTVAIGVPEAILTADLKKWLALYGTGATLLLLAGLGMAIVIGRRIARPIQELIAPSDAIGKGEPVSIPPLALKEADEVRQSLVRAQQLIQQREKERDQAEHAERQMLVAKQAAEQANKAKAAFLANISHELRTPLNAILGFCRLMKNAKDVTAEQTRNLDIINNSGQHLLRLINNVLDISKIESGRVGLEEIDFDLHQLLHEIQSLMQVQAAEKALSFNMVISPEVPRYVTADADKLRQVLINLLGNAIKFTGAGAVWLRAQTTPHESAQFARVRFEVEDSGPGIHDEDRNRIFDQFEQLSEAASSGIGTGLGLHISKQYVELMGGEIGFSTELGKCSIFHFELPLRTTTPSDGIPPKSDRGRITGLAPERQRYRLLIVEDEPQNRLLLHKLLEPLGFDLREAVTGRQAVALAEQWHPHLIWMDICLPDIDGLQATRQIKASEAGAYTKIVALTARALEHERKEILAAGCDDFIRKPYRDTEIFEALEKDLGVRFMYGDDKSPTAAIVDGEVSVAQLRKLPPDLLDELRQAAELLDGQRCLEIARRIGAIDQDLGERLHRIVGNFQYAELLKTLDNSIGARSE
jgi:signal transduction histidine kinase/CheY-like chemotaxis protein